MTELNLGDGLRHALAGEMRHDERVIVMGEEVTSIGGVFGIGAGLVEEFGKQRVLDTPMAVGGSIGVAIGMALHGLRPVLEVESGDCLHAGLDQLVSEAAKIRYRSAGQYSCPLVVRVPYGAGVHGGPYQSQSPESYYCHTPGFTVVAAAGAHDAVGLLRSAIRCEDPVVFFEPKRLYHGDVEEIPEDDYEISLGQARVLRSGSDVSLFTYGGCVETAVAAAEEAAAAGIQVEVVDLRTLLPVDLEAVLASVARTGRAVILSESPKFGSYGGEIAAVLAERAILHLDAPVIRVGGFDAPVPYAFDDPYLPNAARVVAAIERAANF